MSSWIGMAVPFAVGAAGGLAIGYAVSSSSGKSSAPAAPAGPSFEERQAVADELNNNPAYNRFLQGGKRHRTRRGGKKHGHKKTSRR